MKAMVFAAGLGTRLKPITDEIPKALVKVAGKPILQRTLEHLKAHNITEIIVNVHHHAEQVREFVELYPDKELEISVSDESDHLLDTGGGLKKASWFFNDKEPFLVINADVISDLNLSELKLYHKERNALATLVVRDRNSSRCFLFNSDDRLCGWQNKKTGQTILVDEVENLKGWPFSGIHMIDPKLLNLINEEGKFSIVDVYMRLASTHKIYCFLDDNSMWFDIGDTAKLQTAEQWLLQH